METCPCLKSTHSRKKFIARTSATLPSYSSITRRSTFPSLPFYSMFCAKSMNAVTTQSGISGMLKYAIYGGDDLQRESATESPYRRIFFPASTARKSTAMLATTWRASSRSPRINERAMGVSSFRFRTVSWSE